MLTVDEMDKIATMAVEKILLRMPEVIGNLMSHHALSNKLNKMFYDQNPDLQNHKDVVTAVIHEIELQYPEKKYEDILQLAVPKIRSDIKTIYSLDKTHATANLDLTVKSPIGSNGVL